jgi:hypothetical protein
MKQTSPRLPLPRKLATPDPGAYSPDATFSSANKAYPPPKLATSSPRFNSPKNQAPPPGSYDIPSSFGGQSTSLRSFSPRFTSPKSNAPAPGTYDVTSSPGSNSGIKQPGATMKFTGAKLLAVERKGAPAPGEYDPPADPKGMRGVAASNAAFRTHSPRFPPTRKAVSPAVSYEPELPSPQYYAKKSPEKAKHNVPANANSSFRSTAPRFPTPKSQGPPPGAYF